MQLVMINCVCPTIPSPQCAQRWEELRTSSLSIAGDYSGLTATGRPISGQGRRQMTRYVRSMFSQQVGTGSSPSRSSYNAGNHGNVLLKSQSGYHYARQSSGNSNGEHSQQCNTIIYLLPIAFRGWTEKEGYLFQMNSYLH